MQYYLSPFGLLDFLGIFPSTCFFGLVLKPIRNVLFSDTVCCWKARGRGRQCPWTLAGSGQWVPGSVVGWPTTGHTGPVTAFLRAKQPSPVWQVAPGARVVNRHFLTNACPNFLSSVPTTCENSLFWNSWPSVLVFASSLPFPTLWGGLLALVCSPPLRHWIIYLKFLASEGH